MLVNGKQLLDGPNLVADGWVIWCLNGKVHRDDGPAVIKKQVTKKVVGTSRHAWTGGHAWTGEVTPFEEYRKEDVMIWMHHGVRRRTEENRDKAFTPPCFGYAHMVKAYNNVEVKGECGSIIRMTYNTYCGIIYDENGKQARYPDYEHDQWEDASNTHLVKEWNKQWNNLGFEL